MQPTEAFTTLARLGLALRPLGDKLHVEPRDRISAEARALIIAHRDALLDLARQRDSRVAAVSMAVPRRPPSAGAALADTIVAHHERVSIVLECGDIDEPAAHRVATAEVGRTLDDLAGLQLAFWRERIEALPKPADSRIAAVVPTCLAVLDLPWMLDAGRLGWHDCELFGLDLGSPQTYDHNGLVPGLALTAFRRPVRVVSISASDAVIETGSGSRVRHYRTGRTGPPVWEHPAFALATVH